MKSDIVFLIKLLVSSIPFILFALLNSKANMKKEIRNRQYLLPLFAVIYSVVMLSFLNKISELLMDLFLKLADLFEHFNLPGVGETIRDIYSSWGIYLASLLFNAVVLILFIIIKRILTLSLRGTKVQRESIIGSIVEVFYSYDEKENRWYVKKHFGQARTFIKTVYYGSSILAGITLLVSYILCMNYLIDVPFYPVFPIIIIGEIAFFIDGLENEEEKSKLSLETDQSRRIAMYPLLRKPLRDLFGDKLSADGTTVNNYGISGGGVEDILVNLEKEGTHIGTNYAAFIRQQMAGGLKPNIDYVRSGYELAVGKSLLFNTPFYDKLNPYVFYAMNRELLIGGKVMIVLGRHGTEEDLRQWCEKGMLQVSNVPNLWNIAVLGNQKIEEDEMPDIGIISRSSVHDLNLHKNHLPFLKAVSFVMIVEPSRLVTTAQIGLNLLIKNCGREQTITFCSVDRNCDGLVDALSHILMTNITEVSATEYPRGASSFMYWLADNDYVQHRILPGVSRFLGMGTELSMVALKNQVKKTVWYGGDAFPVKDVRWIAKQYYHDLLEYAQLPTTQETFDNCFQTSFNMCNEQVSDYSYITVEDDRNNLFEMRRNFATIAEQQGFVNVISSEYLLREYMAKNSDMFTADPKAIPYITADYARTKRNAVLILCLLLCIDSVQEEILRRHMLLLDLETKDLMSELWREICVIFSDQASTDAYDEDVLFIKREDGTFLKFYKEETLCYMRKYSVESGQFESVYTIENEEFMQIILDDLQNASYIAEQDSMDIYIGTELKGHVYQKYMPGQFFTLGGKYYEMISTTKDDRILVRRAADHIGGRLSYRQVRNYTINHLEDSQSMGALKTVNNIDINYQYADFTVDTPGYWKLTAYNDFDNGDLVMVNGVPARNYHHKQILKFDFSKFGDAFTDSIRMTLTNLLNEVFVTLFADNQPFISAITPGSFDAPMTYSLSIALDIENADKCIFIVEDSQLDIGLLIAVERNMNRILQIISDYLSWNKEQIERSLREQETLGPVKEKKPFDVYAVRETAENPKKKGIFGRIADWFKNLFGKKKGNKVGEEKGPLVDEVSTEEQAVVGNEQPQDASCEVEIPQEEISIVDDKTAEEAKQEPSARQKRREERVAKKAARKEAREAAKSAKKEEKLRKKLEKEASEETDNTLEQEATPKQEVASEKEEAHSESLLEQSEEEASENE